jgi:hypothetical protein
MQRLLRTGNPTTGIFMILPVQKLVVRLLMPVLWLTVGLGHGSAAFAAPPPNVLASSGSITTQFAFADFDGDRQPDLAVLQGEQFSPFKTHYSLTFSLSTGNRQSLRLTGPSGGLLILPRDVNGDNTLDLIVTAKWLHETVAIFLNDGFGGFTSADPARFPFDVEQSDSGLRPAPLPWEHGAVLLGTRPLHGGLAENSSVSLPSQLPGPELRGTSIVCSYLSVSAFSGRAPPSFSHSS